MPQKPLDQMSHTPGRMSESADYILTEMKQAVSVIQRQLEEKADQTTILSLMKNIENLNIIGEQFKMLAHNYQNTYLEDRERCSNETIVSTFGILSSKIDNLTAALLAVGQKLDDETGLASDYKQTILNTVN